MPLFPKLMALLWTFAELSFVALLHHGFRRLDRDQPPVWGLIIGYGLLFGALAWLLFFGESAAAGIVDLSPSGHLKFFRLALWNFFCTIWVILEGVIMLYVIQAHSILKQGSRRASSLIPLRFAISALVLTLLAFYAFFEYSVWLTAVKHQLHDAITRRISIGYVRFCGLFWIGFEVAVAIYGIRIYRRLRRIVIFNPSSCQNG